MKQRIEKKCQIKSAFARPQSYYNQARAGFSALLDFIAISNEDKILLPAYIGWSKKEGSGVFDPIRERSITPVFYHMNRNLEIDLDDCKDKIINSGAKVMLIIHYFGFVDRSSELLIKLAHEHGYIVIEDSAHALYTDKIGEACGRNSDYILYSLHKMLPFNNGGMLVSNGAPLPEMYSNANYDYSQYDLALISDRRIHNYHLIRKEIIESNNSQIIMMRQMLEEGIVPQTFPVIILDSDRYQIYMTMNESGWGVTSLYHTMIGEIKDSEYPNECWISEHILNLPVHQDVDEMLIHEMVCDLNRAIALHTNNQ